MSKDGSKKGNESAGETSAGGFTEDDFDKLQASMCIELGDEDLNGDENSDAEVVFCSDVNKNDNCDKTIKMVRFSIEPIGKEKMIVKGIKRPKEELPDNKDVPKNKKKKDFKPPKLKGNNRDIFCWKCHKFGDDVLDCSTCVRVYHLKCSQLPQKPVNEWICPECDAVMTAEKEAKGTAVISRVTLSELSDLLLFVMKRIRHHEGSKHFELAVDIDQYPEYLDYIVKPTYLGLLEENIKKFHYRSCEQFICDTKWMVHNSYIFNTAYSELTLYARAMVKHAKQECDEILNCPDCYLHANTLGEKEWFIEPCAVPHIIVWARLKGWPYWPCKVMKVSGNNVDVRFFGDHNKSLVPVDCCYLYSKQMPSKQKKFEDLENAIQEAKQHLEKLESKYGKFIYAPPRTILKPKEEAEQRKLLLPGFYGLPIPVEENETHKPETQAKLKVKTEDCKVTIVVPSNNRSPSRNDIAGNQSSPSNTGERFPLISQRATYNQTRHSTGNAIGQKPKSLLSQSAFSPSTSSMKPTIIFEDIDKVYHNMKKVDSLPGTSKQTSPSVNINNKVYYNKNDVDPLAEGPSKPFGSSNRAYCNTKKFRPLTSPPPPPKAYFNKNNNETLSALLEKPIACINSRVEVDPLAGGPSKMINPSGCSTSFNKTEVDPLAGPPKQILFSGNPFNRSYSKKTEIDPLAGPPKQTTTSLSIIFNKPYSNVVKVDPLAGPPKQNSSCSILINRSNPEVHEVDPLASPPKHDVCNNNIYSYKEEVDPLGDSPEKADVTNETDPLASPPKQINFPAATTVTNETDPLAGPSKQINFPSAATVTNETDPLAGPPKQINFPAAATVPKGRIKVKPEFSSANMTLNLNNFFQSGVTPFGSTNDSKHLQIQSNNTIQENQPTTKREYVSCISTQQVSPSKKMFLPVVSKLVSISPGPVTVKKQLLSQLDKDVSPLNPLGMQNEKGIFPNISSSLTGSVSSESKEKVQGGKFIEPKTTADLSSINNNSTEKLSVSGEEKITDIIKEKPEKILVLKVEKLKSDEIKKHWISANKQPQPESSLSSSASLSGDRSKDKESPQKDQNSQSPRAVCNLVEIKRLSNGRSIDSLVPPNAFKSVEKDLDDILLGPSSAKRKCHGIIKRNKNNKQIGDMKQGCSSQNNNLNQNAAILKQLSENSTPPNVVNIIKKSHSDAPIVIIKSSKTSNKVDAILLNLEKVPLSSDFKREKSILKIIQNKPNNNTPPNGAGVSSNQSAVNKSTADDNLQIEGTSTSKVGENSKACTISTPQIDEVRCLENVKTNSQINNDREETPQNISYNTDNFVLDSSSDNNLPQNIRKPFTTNNLSDSNTICKNRVNLKEHEDVISQSSLLEDKSLDKSGDGTNIAKNSMSIKGKNERKSETCENEDKQVGNSNAIVNVGSNSITPINNMENDKDKLRGNESCYVEKEEGNYRKEEIDKCSNDSNECNRQNTTTNFESHLVDCNVSRKSNNKEDKRDSVVIDEELSDRGNVIETTTNDKKVSQSGNCSKTVEVCETNTNNDRTKDADSSNDNQPKRSSSSNRNNKKGKVKNKRNNNGSKIKTAKLTAKDKNHKSSNLSMNIAEEAATECDSDGSYVTKKNTSEVKEVRPNDSDMEDFYGFDLEAIKDKKKSVENLLIVLSSNRPADPEVEDKATNNNAGNNNKKSTICNSDNEAVNVSAAEKDEKVVQAESVEISTVKNVSDIKGKSDSEAQNDNNSNSGSLHNEENKGSDVKCESSNTNLGGNAEADLAEPANDSKGTVIYISDSDAENADTSNESDSESLSGNISYDNWVYNHLTNGVDIIENDKDDSSYVSPDEEESSDESDEGSVVSGDFVCEDIIEALQNTDEGVSGNISANDNTTDKEPFESTDNENRVVDENEGENKIKIGYNISMHPQFVSNKALSKKYPAKRKPVRNLDCFERAEHTFKQETTHESYNEQPISTISNETVEEEAMNEEIPTTCFNCDHEDCDTIREIKRKRWCMFCLKEAVFHCCWFASYCSEKCQYADWGKHHTHCKQREMRFTESDIRCSPVLRELLKDAASSNVLFKDFEELLNSKERISKLQNEQIFKPEVRMLMERVVAATTRTGSCSSSTTSSKNFMKEVCRPGSSKQQGFQFVDQLGNMLVPVEMATKSKGSLGRYALTNASLNNMIKSGKHTFILSNKNFPQKPGKVVTAAVVVPVSQTTKVTTNNNKAQNSSLGVVLAGGSGTGSKRQTTEVHRTSDKSNANKININNKVVKRTNNKNITTNVQLPNTPLNKVYRKIYPKNQYVPVESGEIASAINDSYNQGSAEALNINKTNICGIVVPDQKSDSAPSPEIADNKIAAPSSSLNPTSTPILSSSGSVSSSVTPTLSVSPTSPSSPDSPKLVIDMNQSSD